MGDWTLFATSLAHAIALLALGVGMGWVGWHLFTDED